MWPDASQITSVFLEDSEAQLAQAGLGGLGAHAPWGTGAAAAVNAAGVGNKLTC